MFYMNVSLHLLFIFNYFEFYEIVDNMYRDIEMIQGLVESFVNPSLMPHSDIKSPFFYDALKQILYNLNLQFLDFSL